MSTPFGLTERQVGQLIKPLNKTRVLTAQGHSHLPTFDVIAHLTRIFGIGGWSFEIVDLKLIHERSTGVSDKQSGRWWVTYLCHGRLTIRNLEGETIATFEDVATGSAQNQPSPGDAHDMAVKNARSYCVKRCAKDLGDQFGLSLYNKGSVKPLIGATLTFTDEEDVERHAQAPKTLGNDEVDAPELGETTRVRAIPKLPPRATKDEPSGTTVTIQRPMNLQIEG